MMLKILSIVSFCLLPLYGFTCEKTFKQNSEKSAEHKLLAASDTSQVQQKTTNIPQVKTGDFRNWPVKKIHSLTEQDIQALNREQINGFPLEKMLTKHIGYFTSEQVNNLIKDGPREKQKDKPAEESKHSLGNKPIYFSMFIRAHIKSIEPENIPLIPISVIKLFGNVDIQTLTNKQKDKLTDEQKQVLRKKFSDIKL